MIYIHSVSFHAIERYCQRVIGVDVEIPRDFTPVERAELCCADAGLTIDDVREKILTPAIVKVMDNGFPRVFCNDIEYRFDGGIVITIIHNPSWQKRRYRGKEL